MHPLGIILLIWVGIIIGLIAGFFFGFSKGYNQRERDDICCGGSCCN